MKKLSMLLVLILIMAVILPGCAPKDAGTGEEVAAVKVALVVNQRFGDGGPMDAMSAGADRAAADFGVEVKKLESASAADYEANIRAMSAEGYNLIITTFPQMSDSTKLVSAEFPDTLYSAIFQFINVGDQKFANIWDTEYHGEGAFYIAGTIAGKLTTTNKVGIVIGAEEASPNAEGNGFMRGVKDVNPDATVEFAYVGSYEDPAKAKEITTAMISKGCDVVQTDSGASNAGVIEAAKEAGILVSGEISDFYAQYDGFYGIVGIGFGETVYQSIKMVVEGTFPAGEHGIQDLNNGGYYMDWPSYERFATDKGSQAMTDAIANGKELEAKIKSGEMTIAFDTEVPSWDRIKAE